MPALLLCLTVLSLTNGRAAGCSAQQTITASNPAKVILSCPSIPDNSLRFEYLLLLNNSYVIKLQMQKSQNLFASQFVINEASNGDYVCRTGTIYPPPFREECHSTKVQVKENAPELAVNVTSAPANQSCSVTFIKEVVLWATCGVLLVYSLSITCVVIWKKLKKHQEDTRIYMNTKPQKA